MPQTWLYYVPILIQREGKVGLTAKMVELDQALNSPGAVIALIDSLTDELGPNEVEEGTLPVIPLTWTLITARQGPGVKSDGDKS